MYIFLSLYFHGHVLCKGTDVISRKQLLAVIITIKSFRLLTVFVQEKRRDYKYDKWNLPLYNLSKKSRYEIGNQAVINVFSFVFLQRQ